MRFQRRMRFFSSTELDNISSFPYLLLNLSFTERYSLDLVCEKFINTFDTTSLDNVFSL